MQLLWKRNLYRNGEPDGGILSSAEELGIFFRKDGVTQAADICEACMDAWLGSFQIPPERIERTELFEC